LKVISLSLEKGGVGKTTTAVNLAAALGLAGHRVLVIDLDSQSHATEWLGVNASAPPERSAYGVLVDQAPIATTLLRTPEQGVMLCAAHPFLAKAAKELGDQIDGFFALKDALATFAEDAHATDQQIDLVVIDCPPSKGAIVFNALLAADLVIAPVLAEALSIQGLRELNETVQRIQQRYSPHLPAPMVLINNYDGRALVDRQLHDELRESYGDQVLTTEIGRDAPLRESFAAQASIFRHRRTARSAEQFRKLADEVLRRTQ
jgi:chromosome partitioning protein